MNRNVLFVIDGNPAAVEIDTTGSVRDALGIVLDVVRPHPVEATWELRDAAGHLIDLNQTAAVLAGWDPPKGEYDRYFPSRRVQEEDDRYFLNRRAGTGG